MDIHIWQIIMLTVLAFIMQIDEYGTQFGLIYPGIIGPITGFLLGDFQTGLLIGGTLQLMALGVAAIGGSSVPNYGVAAIISTAIAVASGQGIEAGLAVGLPVGMLGIQFNIFAKLANGFVVRKSQDYCERREFGKMEKILLLCPVFIGLSAAIPTFVSVTFGRIAIEAIINFMPEWFTVGLNIAGKILPVVGIAMLLRYMPTVKFIHLLLIGFVLNAYLNVPILGVALVGFAAAYHLYNQKVNQSFAISMGGMDDDE